MAKLTAKERSALGGSTTRELYGHVHLTEIAQRGGHAVVEKHGREHLAKVGARGGETMAARPGVLASIGAKGGATTYARHGPALYEVLVAKAVATRAAAKSSAMALLAAVEALPEQPTREQVQALQEAAQQCRAFKAYQPTRQRTQRVK